MSLARQGNHSSSGHRVDVKAAIDVNDVPPNKYLHGKTEKEDYIGLKHCHFAMGNLPNKLKADARVESN
ncbi:hypothetical protein ACFX1Q_024558 [Malus domestica]